MADLASQLAASFSDGLKRGVQLYDDLKYTKAEANYRAVDDGNGGSSGERCGGCSHFDGTNLCGIVSGTIHDDDVCDYYSGGGSSKQ